MEKTRTFVHNVSQNIVKMIIIIIIIGSVELTGITEHYSELPFGETLRLSSGARGDSSAPKIL